MTREEVVQGAEIVNGHTVMSVTGWVWTPGSVLFAVVVAKAPEDRGHHYAVWDVCERVWDGGESVDVQFTNGAYIGSPSESHEDSRAEAVEAFEKRREHARRSV